MAERLIDGLLRGYGLTRHPTKGTWGSGNTRLGYLGLVMDMMAETFGVPERKATRLLEKANALLKLAARNRRMVERKVVEKYVGTVSSLAPAVPETGFYLRRVRDSLSRGSSTSPGAAKKRYRFRLSHGVVKDVGRWAHLWTGRSTRAIWPQTRTRTSTLHTDSSISETVRMCLGEFGVFVGLHRGDVVHLWTDNQVIMYIFGKIVSRSTALMSELWRIRKTLKTLDMELEPKYLPSALNLYADRLPRHRKAWDWTRGCG
jgi:hypothetical protein